MNFDNNNSVICEKIKKGVMEKVDDSLYIVMPAYNKEENIADVVLQ